MALTPEQFFGKIGVKNGLFTREQLEACLRLQHERRKATGVREPLSFILIYEKKLISPEQAKDLLQEFKYSCMRKDDKLLAEIAVQQGVLTDEEIGIALSFQRKLFREGVGLFQLGEILIEKEILPEEQVFELACELWTRKRPGQPLPPNARQQLAAARAARELDATVDTDDANVIELEIPDDTLVPSHSDETAESPAVAEPAHDDENAVTKRMPAVNAEAVAASGRSTTRRKRRPTTIIGREALKIRESGGTHKTCRECGYRNLAVATLCYQCGEALPTS